MAITPGLRRQVEGIIDNYLETLAGLRDDYRAISEWALDLAATRASLAETVRAFEAYIEERILWTRSVQGPLVPSAAELARGLAWLLGVPMDAGAGALPARGLFAAGQGARPGIGVRTGEASGEAAQEASDQVSRPGRRPGVVAQATGARPPTGANWGQLGQAWATALGDLWPVPMRGYAVALALVAAWWARRRCARALAELAAARAAVLDRSVRAHAGCPWVHGGAGPAHAVGGAAGGGAAGGTPSPAVCRGRWAGRWCRPGRRCWR
ncbi:MAG: hypothetical protein KatS3mg103_0392 [Phycisphaerales bacterium]|nr:MAG: hypothetical protein KatS3mg103_0392 [Phycisphaerales bacterium]